MFLSENDNESELDEESIKSSHKYNIQDKKNINIIIAKLHNIIYDSLWHYWPDSNRIGLMATLLDPRLKGMEAWSSEIRKQTISELHEEFQEILRTTTSEESSYHQLDQYTTSTPDFMKKVFGSHYQSHINHEIEIEII